MRVMQKAIWLRYGLPIATISLAALLAVCLRSYMEYMRSIFFVLGIIISAWFDGIRAGLLAALLSTLAIEYFLVPPYDSISLLSSDIIGALIFMFVAFLFSYFAVSRRKAEDALRQVNRRQSEFLNVLAHELRNPLGPIRNAVETLGLAKGDDRVIERQRMMIARQVCQMARLLADLLDVSRLGLGKVSLKLERHDLRACTERGGSELQGNPVG